MFLIAGMISTKEAAIILIQAICVGVKEFNPLLMRMNELPQMMLSMSNSSHAFFLFSIKYNFLPHMRVLNEMMCLVIV